MTIIKRKVVISAKYAEFSFKELGLTNCGILMELNKDGAEYQAILYYSGSSLRDKTPQMTIFPKNSKFLYKYNEISEEDVPKGLIEGKTLQILIDRNLEYITQNDGDHGRVVRIENEGGGVWEEKYYDEYGRSQVATKNNIKTVSIYKGNYNGESVLEKILSKYLLPKIAALDSKLQWKSASSPVVLSEVYGRDASSWERNR